MSSEIEKRDDTGYELEAKLERLAEEIGEGFTEMEQRWHATLEMAIEVGHKLIEAKSMVKHGGWLDWLEERFPGSVRKAQNCMKLARKCASVAHLTTVRDALDVVTESRPKPQSAQLPSTSGSDGGRPDRREYERLLAASRSYLDRFNLLCAQAYAARHGGAAPTGVDLAVQFESVFELDEPMQDFWWTAHDLAAEDLARAAGVGT